MAGDLPKTLSKNRGILEHIKNFPPKVISNFNVQQLSRDLWSEQSACVPPKILKK